MTDDGYYQQMIGKGVSQDIRLYPQRFQKCTFCIEPWSQDTIKMLLNCGHFMCSQCFMQEKRCFYPNCKNTSSQIKALQPVNLYEDQSINQQTIFRFSIVCFGIAQHIQREVKGSTTIGDLIKSSGCNAYINKYLPEMILLIIGSKSTPYVKIKNCRVMDVKQIVKIKATIKSKKSYIPILINERYNGGKQK